MKWGSARYCVEYLANSTAEYLANSTMEYQTAPWSTIAMVTLNLESHFTRQGNLACLPSASSRAWQQRYFYFMENWLWWVPPLPAYLPSRSLGQSLSQASSILPLLALPTPPHPPRLTQRHPAGSRCPPHIQHGWAAQGPHGSPRPGPS